VGGVFGWGDFGGEKMVGQIVFSSGPRLFNTLPYPKKLERKWEREKVG